MKFSYYSNLYLKYGEKDWRNSTFIKNLGIVEKRLRVFKNCDIKDISVFDIRNFLISLSVGKKSKKHYISTLSQIFKLAILNGEIIKSPLDFLPKIKYHSPKILPFNSCEVKKILSLSKKYDDNFRLFINMGFYTGMRTGEILALKVSQIDLDKRLILINSTRSRFGENLAKTYWSIREIPIINALYKEIFTFIRKNRSNFYLLEKNKKPYNNSDDFTKTFKEILKILNIPYRRLYNMRHTYATNLLYKNLLSPVELSKLLGHSSVKMVYDVYVNYLNTNYKNFNFKMDIY